MKACKFTIILIAFLLSACAPVVSLNPLSEPADANKQLEGIWKLSSDEDNVFVHIGRTCKNEMLALSVEHKENGTLDISKIPFFLTISGADNYINIKLQDINDDMTDGYEGYIFEKYTFIDKDTLRLYMLDTQELTAAVQTGQLKGQITYRKKYEALDPSAEEYKTIDGSINGASQSIDHVTITDSSKNILKFLESADAHELFSDTMDFYKGEIKSQKLFPITPNPADTAACFRERIPRPCLSSVFQ